MIKLKVKNNILTKTFYCLFLLVFFLGQVAYADLDIPSTDEVMNDIENRYGFDKDAIKQAMDKADYPSVELFFDVTEPEDGDIITATAITTNFLTGNEELYFTWMLLHEEDVKNPDSETIEEAKREAMGIVARGDFDPALFAIDYSLSDSDNDGFKAPVGGGDGVGAKSNNPGAKFESNCTNQKGEVDTSCITRCYEHNFGEKYGAGNGIDNAGEDKIVKCEHKFPEADERESFTIKYEDGTSKVFNCEDDFEIGDGEFNNNEEACWKTDPTNPDTDGDGIEDEADLAGLGQESFTWQYREGDMIGVFVEGTSLVSINEEEVSPYYKITWAGLRVCSSDNKDKDFLDNDKCDDSDDYGYHFYAFQSVNKKADENLETELTFTPSNPQIDAMDEEYSDTIVIDSSITNEIEDDNFVYYKWEIYKCADGDVENCSTNEDSLHLTRNCKKGDLLKDCVKICEDEKGNLKECTGDPDEIQVEVLDSESYAEGMGVDGIEFTPKDKLIKGDKEYLKVYLKTKRYEDDARFSLSDAVIPVSKNNLKLKLFKVTQQEDGKYGFNEDEDEICTEGLYKLLCPVYPYQVVAAKVIDDEYSGATFYWESEDNLLNKPLACDETFSNGCDEENTMYFPISNATGELSDISVKAEVEGKVEGEVIKGAININSQRILSIDNPKAVLSSEDYNEAWPTIIADGTKADDYFNTEPGKQPAFRAEVVPDYLEIDEDVFLTWYLNGSEVTEDLVENNPDLGIGYEEKRITFTVLGKIGSSESLGARVVKNFSLDDQLLLQKNWNSEVVDSIENTSNVVLRKIYDPSNDEDVDETASLKVFLASTLKNSPDYLTHILRLSIILIIIWGIIFGADYFIKDEIIRKIKK